MYTRKQALAFAKQLRTCPSYSVKNDPGYEKENARHKLICPFCASDIHEEFNNLQKLEDSFRADFPELFYPHNAEGISPEPGQIWRLKQEFACWRDDYYYGVPDVLILKRIPEADQAFIVAQVYPEIILAGPGDLVLPPSMFSGYEELFIQPWNMYTLKTSFLGGYQGKVESCVVQQTLSMIDDLGEGKERTEDDLPKWALKTMPMIEEDPRLYFREIEVETGFTFSAQAVSQLVEEMENQPLPGISLESLIQNLKEKVNGLIWDSIPRTVEQCLAFLKFPQNALPLHAAESDIARIIAPCYRMRQDRMKQDKIEHVFPVECQILHPKTLTGEKVLSGSIQDFQGKGMEQNFYCYIKSLETNDLYPGNFIYDSEGKNFIAEFDRSFQDGEEFVLYILQYSDSSI